MRDSIHAAFESARATLDAFLAGGLDGVERFADAALKTLQDGGKLLACGNGGSMCDAMHFAEEWTGRFRGDRDALPAIAFSDPSQLTCIANDFGYERVFARQCEALLESKDVLLVLSTSGTSPNLVEALKVARQCATLTVGLLGSGGGDCGPLCDHEITIDETDSAFVQEAHQVVVHLLCEMIEESQ